MSGGYLARGLLSSGYMSGGYLSGGYLSGGICPGGICPGVFVLIPLKRIPRRNHITPVLRELHWLRIHDRIIFKILLLTHKAVNNNAPEYLCDLIRLNVKSTIIRTRASFDPCLLCVPPISKTCANSFFDRSFVYAAPTLWNALDLDIRLLPFDAFKKRVKTHLYLKYFAN